MYPPSLVSRHLSGGLAGVGRKGPRALVPPTPCIQWSRSCLNPFGGFCGIHHVDTFDYIISHQTPCLLQVLGWGWENQSSHPALAFLGNNLKLSSASATIHLITVHSLRDTLVTANSRHCGAVCWVLWAEMTHFFLPAEQYHWLFVTVFWLVM